MRRTLCTAVIATLVLGAGSSGADAAGPPTPLGYPSPNTKVASGTWNGHRWTLFAGESRTATWFSKCMKVALVPASMMQGGKSCDGGGLRRPGELLPTSPPAPGWGYGIAPSAYGACPTFMVFAGTVVAPARTVVFTLTSGRTVTTETIPSPPRFAQSLRFWATHLPCGAKISALEARDANGRVVARFDSRFVSHLP
jgi:hypothetical protein